MTWEVKRGGEMHTIETLYGGRELFTLHPFEKKLGKTSQHLL